MHLASHTRLEVPQPAAPGHVEFKLGGGTRVDLLHRTLRAEKLEFPCQAVSVLDKLSHFRDGNQKGHSVNRTPASKATEDEETMN